MMKTLRGKIMILLAALGLGTGFTLIVTKDSCDAKPIPPAPPAADAGSTSQGQ